MVKLYLIAGSPLEKFKTRIMKAAISDKKEEKKQLRNEEEYIQNVKGFYKLLAVAILSLLVAFIIAVNDSSNWSYFLWILLSWGVLLVIYSLNVFNLFGEEWKRKLIKNKFDKK
ncbi:MAG: hypothetical protein GQ574_14020 [Crocinitomix sp.]|nr:hypothetical protein [Crocinitomix sp.]